MQVMRDCSVPPEAPEPSFTELGTMNHEGCESQMFSFSEPFFEGLLEFFPSHVEIEDAVVGEVDDGSQVGSFSTLSPCSNVRGINVPCYFTGLSDAVRTDSFFSFKYLPLSSTLN